MRKIVLTFGLISGALCSVMMLITIPFEDKIGFEHGMVVGYATIAASFLLVYFGIRSYRDDVGGADHIWPGVRIGDFHNPHHLRLLCGHLGGDLLLLDARFYGQVQCLRD